MTDKSGKGTRKGKPNYKSQTLLKAIRSILPASKAEWEEVARDYQMVTKEEDERGYEDVKRHFIKKMCDSNKKVTGSSGPAALILASQKVYQEILEKEEEATTGARSHVKTKKPSKMKKMTLMKAETRSAAMKMMTRMKRSHQ